MARIDFMGLFSRLGRLALRLNLRVGEMDGDGGSHRDGALRLHRAVVELDHLAGVGEAEAGTEALGGEEGLKNGAQLLFVDTCSVVLDLNHRLLPSLALPGERPYHHG